MSDSKRRCQGIRRALNQVYPSNPTRAMARHLNVWAAMISGIIGCQSTSLPHISRRCSLEALPESRVKRFSRWLKDEVVELETFFMPFDDVLICPLCPSGLVLVIDGSCVGRGCVALVMGVVYKKRALPLAWMVVRGQKRHLLESNHMALREQLKEIIPQGTQVTLQDDGEFDSVDLQSLVSGWEWHYVLRTGKHITLPHCGGEKFCFEALGDTLLPGEMLEVAQTYFTVEQFDPLIAITSWGREGARSPSF